MHPNPKEKYKPFANINIKNRKWPDKKIEKSPIWCSVDLRDGNQALVNPMGTTKKLEMFKKLIEIGFKEIEIGFPAAAEMDYKFLRHIIDEKLIPQDVTIQVLVQARNKLIDKTFEAIRGARRVIVHLYNSTSKLQREVVFKADKKNIIDIAVNAAIHIKKHAEKIKDTEIIYQYSPESFTGTEIDFAAQICDEVCKIYQPDQHKKVIINLPATVEMSMPNLFADQIEMFCQIFQHRNEAIISLHTHNDRGTGIAASELGILAGGERIEGTLLGNGERTGNLDILTMALNMYSQGIHPNLDFSEIKKIKELVEYCTQIKTHQRHPYAGELVFTAFSGSHQDAIKKGFEYLSKNKTPIFQVPYFAIDPDDIGRRYDPFIRINAQSGKAGVAYLIQKNLGFKMPRDMQIEFSKIIQQITDQTEEEIDETTVSQVFENNYLNIEGKLKYQSHAHVNSNAHVDSKKQQNFDEYRFNINYQNDNITVNGKGRGPLEAFINALKEIIKINYEIIDYFEHSISSGSDSYAASYVKIYQRKNNQKPEKNDCAYGVGKDRSITKASLHAVVSAINRYQKMKP